VSQKTGRGGDDNFLYVTQHLAPPTRAQRKTKRHLRSIFHETRRFLVYSVQSECGASNKSGQRHFLSRAEGFQIVNSDRPPEITGTQQSLSSESKSNRLMGTLIRVRWRINSQGDSRATHRTSVSEESSASLQDLRFVGGWLSLCWWIEPRVRLCVASAFRFRVARLERRPLLLDPIRPEHPSLSVARFERAGSSCPHHAAGRLDPVAARRS
jgi:hypothetical protein